MVPGVLLFSLVLIQAPALFGDAPPIEAYAVALAPFPVAILALSLWKPRWQATWWTLVAVAYVALLILAAFRGAHYKAISDNAAALEAVQFTLLATLGAFAFLRERRDEARARYLRALCWAPATFLLVNVLLHLIGFVPPEQINYGNLPATMIGLLGVPANRVTFAMSGGLNGIAPTAVAAFVISGVFVLRFEQRKLAIAAWLLSVYVILAVDSRGALMFAVLALAILVLTPRARRRGLGWVAILLPILPVVLILVLTSLADTDIGASLNRQGGEDIATGTGRTVVWGEVLKVIGRPGVNTAFGYGQNGQETSGASIGYAYLFPGDPDPLAHSAHNLVLQAALDIGIVGAVLLIALAAAVLVRLARRTRDPLYEALTGAVLALLLLGLVQADPTPVHADSFAFWLLVVFAATRAFSAEPVADGTPPLPTAASRAPAELAAAR